MLSDTPRNKLRVIIGKYGTGICNDPRRCEALLNDLCGAYRLEINLLLNALRERVATDLLNQYHSTPLKVLFAKLSSRLQHNLGLTELHASWSVSSWCEALGLPAAVSEAKLQSMPRAPIAHHSSLLFINTEGYHSEGHFNNTGTTTSIESQPTPLDKDLRTLLDSTGATWCEFDVWRNSWLQLFRKAEMSGMDERAVRQRCKVLWDEKKLNNNKSTQDLAHAQRQNVTEENHKKHLELLCEWRNKLPNDKWNYSQWDDFIDSLSHPADIPALEKARDSRFILNDLTINDNNTGLMWVKNGNMPGRLMTWNIAKKYVESLNRQKFCGYNNWRLPAKNELEHLMQAGISSGFGGKGKPCIADYFNSIGFNEVQSDIYWSSCIHTVDDSSAWFVDLRNAYSYFIDMNSRGLVWPTRGKRLPI